MQVAEAMSTDFFAVRPEETVADAARSMVEAWVGSAVLEPDRPGSPPGIFTERDAVKAVAAGVDAQSARVADHSTPEATVAAPDWSLEDVDGLDPSVVAATGTPEPGGLTWSQALEVIRITARASARVVAVDCVELAPREGQHAADFAVARLVYKAISHALAA